MTRHPLLAVGLVGSLVGGIVSGCSDTAPAASSAAADGAQSAASVAPKTAASVEQATAPAGAGTDFASAWGPAVGTKIPLLAASDHTGATQNLASLTGAKGLLLVFSRSADW